MGSEKSTVTFEVIRVGLSDFKTLVEEETKFSSSILPSLQRETDRFIKSAASSLLDTEQSPSLT